MGNKIQNEDVKSQADLVAQGLTSGEAFDALIDDTKIAIKANSINKTLNQAIIDGDLSGGGGGGASGIYFGPIDTDGTFRIIQDGTNLKIQVRSGGVYVDKDVIGA